MIVRRRWSPLDSAVAMIAMMPPEVAFLCISNFVFPNAWCMMYDHLQQEPSLLRSAHGQSPTYSCMANAREESPLVWIPSSPIRPKLRRACLRSLNVNVELGLESGLCPLNVSASMSMSMTDAKHDDGYLEMFLSRFFPPITSTDYSPKGVHRNLPSSWQS